MTSCNEPGNNTTTSSFSTTTHGGTCEMLILPNETREHFEALLQDLQAEYLPETTQQHLFIEQLAISHWYLWRRQRAYNAIETGTYNVERHPSRWVEDDHRRLAWAERHRTAAERALKRALHNAESIRKQRLSEHDRLECHNRWRAEQDLREARQRHQEEKVRAAAAKSASTSPPSSPDSTPTTNPDHFVSQKTPFLRLVQAEVPKPDCHEPPEI